MRFINQEGKEYGKLKVGKRIGTKCQSPLWECDCECGNKTTATTRDLTTGHKQSCGCAVAENHFRIHNGKKTRLYCIWKGMRQRCNNPKNHAYHHYGGRGITICKEWDSFEIFRDWALTNGYEDTLTIDRKDNNGNYEPSNCRWATQKEQMNNVSYNRRVEWNGEEHTVSEWSEITGISRGVIAARLNNGWSIERTLTEVSYLGKNQFT